MKHGGDLSQAAEGFSAGSEGWLDLSTGINPVAYPFTPPGPESWQRLPQSGALSGLIEAARIAYSAPDDAAIVAAPGTQMLIQLLPMVFPAEKVAVVGPTYSEHALCWQAAGADIVMIHDLSRRSPSPGAIAPPSPEGERLSLTVKVRERGEGKQAANSGETVLRKSCLDSALSPGGRGRREAPGEGGAYFAEAPEDCSVVVNPNNPDGRSWQPEHILRCADGMAGRGGLLIVDEAFADVQPEVSVVPYAGREGLVVLRSFGKFFGLAGVRLGFALGPQALLTRMADLLGPWAVSGPAIDIGTQALRDMEWQSRARMSCAEMATRLDVLLTDAGFEIAGGTPLFRLAQHEHAQDIHRDLARQGIWVRRFEDHPQWLRFGLPGGEAELNRLAAALR